MIPANDSKTKAACRVFLKNADKDYTLTVA